MTDVEVFLLLEGLAARVNADLGLDLSVPARRRIVQRVLDSADYDNAVATAHEMMAMLLNARTLN
jgi:hypothetical protein